jgi:hypothetical protein
MFFVTPAFNTSNFPMASIIALSAGKTFVSIAPIINTLNLTKRAKSLLPEKRKRNPRNSKRLKTMD